MEILYGQSDHTFCKIFIGDFKQQDRKNFQGNIDIIKQIVIKQIHIEEIIQVMG